VVACRLDGLGEDERTAIKARFQSFVLLQTEALLSSFPFKNYASFMLAPMKVYPEIQKRVLQEKIEPVVAIETYGVLNASKEIRFIIPIGADKSAYQPLFDAFAG
jgi:hypothetical protein